MKSYFDTVVFFIGDREVTEAEVIEHARKMPPIKIKLEAPYVLHNDPQVDVEVQKSGAESRSAARLVAAQSAQPAV